VVHAPAIVRVPESALELGQRDVEGLIEVGRAGLGPDDRTARAARDLDVLTASVLPSVLLVVEFHVGAADLVVVPLDLGEFVTDVLSEMIGYFDVASADYDFHLSLASFHAASTVAHAS
jgi:hypothetical protein